MVRAQQRQQWKAPPVAPSFNSILLSAHSCPAGSPVGAGRGRMGGGLPLCYVMMGSWAHQYCVWSFTGPIFSAWFVSARILACPAPGSCLFGRRAVPGESTGFSLESSTRHLEYNFHRLTRLLNTRPSALCLSYAFYYFILISTRFGE